MATENLATKLKVKKEKLFSELALKRSKIEILNCHKSGVNSGEKNLFIAEGSETLEWIILESYRIPVRKVKQVFKNDRNSFS